MPRAGNFMCSHGLRILIIVTTLFTFAQFGFSAESPSIFKTPKQLAPPKLFSIVPAQAEPGALISIALSDVSEDIKVILGGDEISWHQIDPRHLTFHIPEDMPSGQYALTIKTADGSSRSYAFTILPLKPVAVSIEPDRVTSCASGSAREVTIHGRNFSLASQLLFDGAIIHSKVSPPNTIKFIVPNANAGLHQVAVKNGDNQTTPLAVSIINAPDISSIRVGEDHVNSYDLIIEGDNFSQTSSLVVDGAKIDTSGGPQGDRLIYIDCTMIIYQRHPYSSSPKDLRIQVVNSSGENSKAILITAP